MQRRSRDNTGPAVGQGEALRFIIVRLRMEPEYGLELNELVLCVFVWHVIVA